MNRLMIIGQSLTKTDHSAPVKSKPHFKMMTNRQSNLQRIAIAIFIFHLKLFVIHRISLSRFTIGSFNSLGKFLKSPQVHFYGLKISQIVQPAQCNNLRKRVGMNSL